jgi:hypothetical protein
MILGSPRFLGQRLLGSQANVSWPRPSRVETSEETSQMSQVRFFFPSFSLIFLILMIFVEQDFYDLFSHKFISRSLVFLLHIIYFNFS